MAWLVVVLYLLNSFNPIKSQAIQITDIRFGANATYSTSVLGSYAPLTIWFKVLYSNITAFGTYVRVELPHAADGNPLDMGFDRLTTWTTFPGSDRSWKAAEIFYENIYTIRSAVDTTGWTVDSPLYAGYQGKLVISDVRMPSDCIDPGEYTLTIGTASTTYRPVSRYVLCPEIAQMDVSLYPNTYDTSNITLYFSIRVAYFNFTITNGYFDITFPYGSYPEVYVIGTNATTTFSAPSFRFVPTVNGYYNGEYLPNVTTSKTIGYYHQPRWRHRFLLDIVSWKSDSVLNFTFGPILTPWSCSNQLPICVQVGPIKGCATPSGVVQGCPVLKNLNVEFTPSNRYLTKEATATFRFTVADYPLYAKPKYQVRLDFPSYVGFILRYSYLDVDATPLAQIYQSTQTYSDLRFLTQKNSFQIFDDTDPYVVFMLNGTSDYEPDYMTRYVPANTEVTIKLVNVTLPANCDYHYYNLSIGPFTASAVMSSEISGCVNISDLDLTFSPNNYQSSVVTAKFSFTVGTWPMATDFVKITYPYYTGSGKQFKVTSYAHDRRRFSMNGFANGGVTLYKGLTYVFEVNSRGAPFAIVNDVYTGNETWVDTYGTLYTNGVTNNNIEVGYLWFTVPFNAPSTLVYQCTTHPLMKGDIKILDRPRGIQLANSYFGSRSGSVTGTLFDSNAQVVKKWQAYDTPTITTNYVSGRPSTETFLQFYSRNENVDSVPVQYGAVMEVSNVQLPTDECDDLGSFTLTVGLWGTTANPVSDILYCPYIRDLEVRYFSHVAGTQDNIAYLTFTNYGAPLSARDVTVLFPPLSGISLSNSAGFLSLNGDWTSSRAPIVVNYHGVQVSISLLSTSGTAIQPNVSRSTIAVYGVNLPSACGSLPSLGNYTLVIGPYRVEYDPPTDYLFCPNMTMLDVMFDPVANQSATTDAYISFNISDYMDPGTINIYIPPTISFTYGSFVWVAKVGDEYPGWTLDSKTLKRDFINNILQIKPTSGRRLSPGRHYIRITNITLPRGNCSDLGLWGVQIGPTSLFENPPSDVVEGCVVLKDLIVTFAPSHEQGGQGVNMTFTFTVTKSALWFIYGDSDWIDFTIPSSVGVTVGSDSQFVNVLGNWQPIPTRKVVKSNGLKQTFSDGNMINVGQRVSFTVTNTHLPKNCLNPGDWVVNIGIWSLTASPVNNTGLVLCPKITNLEVVYSPSIACNDVGIIKVFFDVEDMQLRAGVLKFDFPPDSGVTLWPFATISDGPGDWVCGPKAPVVIPPVAKCPKCCDQTEISYTQTCTGSPLPVGRNYSFIMHNVGTPCKNCTDVGLYKLAVDQWTSVWTNPKLDVLACPGIISGINVTMSPVLMNRRSPNATYRFKFTVPNCQFNEIRIQFPEGYQPSRTYPTAITDSFGVTLYRTYVVVEGRVLILRNITCDPSLPRASSSLPPSTPADSQYIYLEVSNIGLPNNCDPGTWLITTRTCGYYDRSEGQYPPIFYCPKSFGDASGVVTSADAVPYFCSSCNACYVEFLDSNKNPVYECTNNDLTFQRTSLDSSTCSTTTTNPAPEF